MTPWGMEGRYGFGAARIPLAPESGPRRRRMLSLREGLESRRRDGTDTSLAHWVRSASPIFLLVLALTVLLSALVGAPRDDSSIQIVQFATLEDPAQPLEVARAEPPEPVPPAQPPPAAVPEPAPPPPKAPAEPEPVHEAPPPARANPPAPQIEAPVHIARATPARPRSTRPKPLPSPAPERRPQLAIEALAQLGVFTDDRRGDLRGSPVAVSAQDFGERGVLVGEHVAGVRSHTVDEWVPPGEKRRMRR